MPIRVDIKIRHAVILEGGSILNGYPLLQATLVDFIHIINEDVQKSGWDGLCKLIVYYREMEAHSPLFRTA